jgi:hypothetical protein
MPFEATPAKTGIAWSGHVRRYIETSAMVCLLARSPRAGATAPTTSLLLPCHKRSSSPRPRLIDVTARIITTLRTFPTFYTRYNAELHAWAAGSPLSLRRCAHARALNESTNTQHNRTHDHHFCPLTTAIAPHGRESAHDAPPQCTTGLRGGRCARAQAPQGRSKRGDEEDGRRSEEGDKGRIR